MTIPTAGGVGCILRLEVNASLTAVRFTVRSSHPAISDSLMRGVAALLESLSRNITATGKQSDLPCTRFSVRDPTHVTGACSASAQSLPIFKERPLREWEHGMALRETGTEGFLR